MRDNLITATNRIRTSVTSVKRKLSQLRVSVEELNLELEAIDSKFERLLSESEIYKAKLDREMGREVRRLEKENAALRKQIVTVKPTQPQTPGEILSIASTMSVFECILKQIANGSDDFRLISYSFLFPAIVERLVKGDDEAYFLDELPSCTSMVIDRGRSYVEWIRSECATHLTDAEAWAIYGPKVTNWWRNDALPLLYGCRDEQWDIDMPLSLPEILLWRESPGDRPLNFPKIFDAYEIYRKHKDEIYEISGLRDFELKLFTFETEEASQSRFKPR